MLPLFEDGQKPPEQSLDQGGPKPYVPFWALQGPLWALLRPLGSLTARLDPVGSLTYCLFLTGPFGPYGPLWPLRLDPPPNFNAS